METILVPTDFSLPAENALRYAVELAKYFDTRIALVHAYSTPPIQPDTGVAINLISVWRDESLKRLKEIRSELLKDEGRGLTIECFTEIGPILDVIDSAAKKYEADLIVMGIVGEVGKIREHIIGSSAVKVARYSNLPTFIIPEKVKYKPIHKISFACDMEKTEETDLITTAKYFSKMFDAELEIVNVERPEEEVTIEKAGTNLFIERQLNYVKHRTVFITESKITRGLKTYFETHESDVVMLSPKKHTIFHMLFKENVTNGLAFHVHVPILAIH